MATETMAKTKWTLDPIHSEVGFKVKHMMITNVSGSFGQYGVKAETDGNDFSSARFEFTASAESISTGNTDRDKHLKSGDFFDSAQYPELKFVSTNVTKRGGDQFEVIGDLTIKGVTRSVTLNVEYGGIGKDPWGNEKAGFTIETKFKRTDFGLNWNAALETGGVLVSDEVRVFAEVQLVREASK